MLTLLPLRRARARLATGLSQFEAAIQADRLDQQADLDLAHVTCQ